MQNMGLFTTSPHRKSFLRIPSSPIDEDQPFIEPSQAIDVHRFERKLNILITTTGLLSLAIIALVVVVILKESPNGTILATVSEGT